MSKESEETFDLLQKQAKDSQMVVLYFLAILPSGEAINVHAHVAPEFLEEIGLRPSLSVGNNKPGKPSKELLANIEKLKTRGEREAQFMTRQINPMISVLLESLILAHVSS